MNIMELDAISDVDGNRWVPVLDGDLAALKAKAKNSMEVVMCKDCKHYDNTEGIQWCHLNSKFSQWGMDWHSFPEDGFCSYGERRTDA